MNVDHTAIWVSDLDRSQKFFTETLDLETQRSYTRNGIDNIVVGGDRAAIQLRTEPNRDIPPERRDRTDHLALTVTDIEDVCARLREAGHEVFRSAETIERLDVRIAFVWAPDGYAVELVERL